MPSPSIYSTISPRATHTALICSLLLCTAPLAIADGATSPQISTTLAQSVETQGKALLEAARSGNLNTLRLALESGVGVDFTDKGGTTALMLAAQNGKSDLVSFLLEKGANPNLQNKDGRTALHLATQIGAPKKKKFNIGKIAKVAGTVMPMFPGGALLSAMGTSLDSLGGIGNLANLGAALGGKHSAAGTVPSGFDLSNKAGWTTIIATALQGDAKLGGSLNLDSLLSSDFSTLKATDWINLMSGVQGANPQVIAAISNLASGDAAQGELWSQFVNMAATNDRRGVIRALSDPQYKPLLEKATSAFAAATGELPGNAGRHIVSALLAKGANATFADEDQHTAAQLAQARGWDQVATLLGAPVASLPASNR